MAASVDEAKRRGTVLPVYVVVDESLSMSNDIGHANEGIRSLLDACSENPRAAGKVRISIIGFANEAEMRLPMIDFREIEGVPELSVHGDSTSYSEAFRFVQHRIPADLADLNEQGLNTFRPAVFFVTDGQPMEGEEIWQRARDDLVDPSWDQHANILAFGVGEAAKDPRVMLRIATDEMYAYVQAKGGDTGQALITFFDNLTHSLVAIGAGTVPMERPAGFQYALDVISPETATAPRAPR